MRQFNINFMGQRKLWFAFSIILSLISVVSLAVNGLNLGLDFTGGTLVELKYSAPVELNQVRKAMANAGYDQAIVQHFGSASDVVIRLGEKKDKDQTQVGNEVLAAAEADFSGTVSKRRVDYIGSQVGGELRDKGGLGMLIALIVVMIYVAVRFQSKFALGAAISTVHDVIVVLGVFSLFKLTFDLNVLAAILALIGYSLNDTIIVYDRVRENFRKMRRASATEVVNRSVNQTLTRTINTSATTILVLLALFFFGGAMIHGFASAMLLGVIFGTYSSIYIASSSLISMRTKREDLLAPVKEGVDDRP
jgi:preprotein translocase subunit SecF